MMTWQQLERLRNEASRPLTEEEIARLFDDEQEEILELLTEEEVAALRGEEGVPDLQHEEEGGEAGPE